MKNAHGAARRVALLMAVIALPFATPAVAQTVVTVSDVVVDESANFAEFVVRLNAPSANTVSLSYSTSTGTAGYGDFGDIGWTALAFAPGEVQRVIRIAVADDGIAENDESFHFWLGYPVMVYLIIVATIDIEHRLVLRPLSIAGLVLCTAAGIIIHGWLDTLIGGAVGFIIMWLLYQFGRLFSRRRAKRMGLEQPDGEEALGSGDVTMATILGLLLGWPLIWGGLLLGILLAGAFSLLLVFILLASKKYKEKALNLFIPYVPFFIIAAILLFYLPGWMEKII